MGLRRTIEGTTRLVTLDPKDLALSRLFEPVQSQPLPYIKRLVSAEAESFSRNCHQPSGSKSIRRHLQLDWELNVDSRLTRRMFRAADYGGQRPTRFC